MCPACVPWTVGCVATLGGFYAWTEKSKVVIKTHVNLKALLENVKNMYREMSVDQMYFDH